MPDQEGLSFSRRFKTLHFQEVEILLRILREVASDRALTEPEQGVRIKLEEIRHAMVRKRRSEDTLAARAAMTIDPPGSKK
jgi:hypothetical protein